jgi:hypothetical protein
MIVPLPGRLRKTRSLVKTSRVGKVPAFSIQPCTPPPATFAHAPPSVWTWQERAPPPVWMRQRRAPTGHLPSWNGQCSPRLRRTGAPPARPYPVTCPPGTGNVHRASGARVRPDNSTRTRLPGSPRLRRAPTGHPPSWNGQCSPRLRRAGAPRQQRTNALAGITAPAARPYRSPALLERATFTAPPAHGRASGARARQRRAPTRSPALLERATFTAPPAHGRAPTTARERACRDHRASGAPLPVTRPPETGNVHRASGAPLLPPSP